MPAIEFIYFDLGKVVLNFSHELGCQQMADIAQVSYENAWSAVFEGDLLTRYETGLITGVEFHNGFCQATDSNPDCQELLRAYSHIFTPNLPILPLVCGLVAIDFPRGILSNTCEAHWSHLIDRYTFVGDFFPRRVLSYEAHSMKPDQAIYRSAIELAGVASNRIFFTDDREENVAGAIRAGIDAVLFESPQGLAAELRRRGIDV